jgi:hypothetical protein
LRLEHQKARLKEDITDCNTIITQAERELAELNTATKNMEVRKNDMLCCLSHLATSDFSIYSPVIYSMVSFSPLCIGLL